MTDDSQRPQHWWDTWMPSRAEEKAFFWGLVLPMALVVVGFKLWRIATRGEVSTWWAAPDLVRSDLLAVAAFAALGWAAFRPVSGALGRRIMLGLVQALAVVWAALEVVANHFFAVTGSTFDLHLLFFSVGRFEETFSVVTSEVSVAFWVLLVGVVALLVALPWALRHRFDEDLDRPGSSPWRRAGIATVIGLGCLLLAMVPPVGEDYAAFGRANLVNMALSLHDVRITGEVESNVERRSLEALELVPTDRADEGPRHVAIIILESTRAKSTTVHDESMETTPYLADLATRSTVADRAYVTVPHTSKALVSILCGMEPRLRMPITEAMPGGLPVRCIADLLGDRGFRSVFFQSATERFEDRPGLVENMGYDEFFPLERMDSSGFEEANYFGYEDAIMLSYSENWHRQREDGRILTTYLTLTPHHDYLAPGRYGRFDFAKDDELNRYKNTLYYVDQFTRELMEQYRAEGIYEDTLFVIVGDHGEGFEEHGRSQHDNVIWEEGVHVPLLFYHPGETDGERLSYPVSHIDVVPTILAWLGYEVDGGEYPGMPVWDSHEDREVYAHCWYERRCMARIGMRWKYIDHFGQRAPEVYDLIDDPDEQHNLAADKKDAMRTWRSELYGWREAVNAMYRRQQADRVEAFILDELPDELVEMDFDLGEFARYRGYRLSTDQLRAGRRVTITHYFEVLQSIPGGWNLFVHGEGGGRMLNLDHLPVDGLHPLDNWEPGTIVADEHSFRVPREAASESFTLYLGIYHRDQGRVPIFGEVDTDGDRRAKIFELPVH